MSYPFLADQPSQKPPRMTAWYAILVIFGWREDR